IVVVDMRWRESGSGRQVYERGHIPGARYLDWSTDLVDPDAPVAFTLAPPGRFAAAMARCGIDDETTVVAYADGMGNGPFRLWWASRGYGHDDVAGLDGGFGRWCRPDHTMKSPEELRALFAAVGVAPSTRAITYCGCGISASALLFAATLAGIEDVTLYDASWEEWGRDPELPVARG